MERSPSTTLFRGTKMTFAKVNIRSMTLILKACKRPPQEIPLRAKKKKRKEMEVLPQRACAIVNEHLAGISSRRTVVTK